MRFRLFAAGMLAVGLVVGSASIALAQEGEGGGTTNTTLSPVQAELHECLETQLAAPTPDLIRCAQAPNPILPATNEIIAGALAFFILLGVLGKFAYPQLKQGMDNRAERIRTDLQQAEEARVTAEEAAEEYRQRLAAARQDATRIIEDARATADSMKQDLARQAETEIAEMKQRAAADIESAKTQAFADLQDEVAQLAIGAAEVVVQKNLDQATQIQLIENYINEVGGEGLMGETSVVGTTREARARVEDGLACVAGTPRAERKA